MKVLLKDIPTIINYFGQSAGKNQADLLRADRRAAANSTYKKLAVQWLHEALCFVSSSLVADSFRLRNRQLLVAAKRWLYVPSGN